MAYALMNLAIQWGKHNAAAFERSAAFYFNADPSLVKQLTGKEWYRDGITEEESALIVALQSFSGQEEAFLGLLNDGNVNSDTFSLPLAGETNAYVVSRSSSQETQEVLETMRIGMRVIEDFIGDSWPLDDAVLVLEPDSRGPFYGRNFGDHILVKHSGRYLIWHELGHDYFRGTTEWLDEGAADFLAAYTMGADGSNLDRVHVNLHQRLQGRIDECAASGAPTIQKYAELVQKAQTSATSIQGCNIILGEAYLLLIYDSLGYEVLSSALRDIYRLSLEGSVTEEDIYRLSLEGSVTEEDIYRLSLEGSVTEEDIFWAFHGNTPASKRGEFRELYSLLHGGLIPEG